MTLKLGKIPHGLRSTIRARVPLCGTVFGWERFRQESFSLEGRIVNFSVAERLERVRIVPHSETA
jgi:hypothetical protein